MSTETKRPKRCETCAFYVPGLKIGPIEIPDGGYCFYHPPQTHHGGPEDAQCYAYRPTVYTSNFCSSWTPQSWHEEVSGAE